MLRLVGTDFDGTLLRADLTVSDMTRAVVRRARALGVHVVPATARQHASMADIAAACALDGWAVCANGAVVVHLTTGEVLVERRLDPAAMTTLATRVREAWPGVSFAAVSDGGIRAEATYAAQVRRTSAVPIEVLPLEDVVGSPTVKLMFRHPDVDPAALYETVGTWSLPGVSPTFSGAPWVEAMAAGVSKASGLALLCDHLGIAPADVATFGDGLNDLEMLAWAGRSWAMANAAEAVRTGAGAVAPSNEDDGVARVVAALLDEQGAGEVQAVPPA